MSDVEAAAPESELEAAEDAELSDAAEDAELSEAADEAELSALDDDDPPEQAVIATAARMAISDVVSKRMYFSL